jgi:hypothetical protein
MKTLAVDYLPVMQHPIENKIQYPARCENSDASHYPPYKEKIKNYPSNVN